MRFRNYCLVVIGNTLGVLEEIEKISETKPNTLNGGGLVVSTFSSTLTPSELTDWFIMNQRSFILTDLNQENCGFNIMKKGIHEGLFGFLKTINLDDKSAELLREIQLTSDTKTDRTNVQMTKKPTKAEVQITEADVEKMTKDDRDNLLNKLIDNGVEKLSENDKYILQILAKY